MILSQAAVLAYLFMRVKYLVSTQNYMKFTFIAAWMVLAVEVLFAVRSGK